MRIPATATSFTPEAAILAPGAFQRATLRHTVRPAGSKDWLLIYTLGGSGLYQFPGGTFHSRPHHVTLYRPGFFQDYQIDPKAGKWDLLFAHFSPKPEWLSWLGWPELSPGLMSLSVKDAALRRRMAARLRDMVRLHASARARNEAFAQNALEEVLLWCDSVNPRQLSEQMDSRVGKALDFLTTHLTEPFSEEKLARNAGVSASRLRHLFRRQVGNSPRQFQEGQRLQRARNLLALSRQTIGEIATELGFASPFYFTLRFKKQTGESPRAYRRRVTRA